MSNRMRPFRVAVAQADLDDLRHRLAATRWLDDIPGAGWSRGVPAAYLRDLAEHWATRFDWRVFEARINRRPQILAEVDGQDIHAIHARSARADARPLLVLHGWPGSIVELLDVIDPLTDPVAHGGAPEDAFHVVAPSLPGFGFSGPTRAPGWHARRIAAALARLMASLGYHRYGIHGGDWGAIIGREVGRTHPAEVAGVHLTMLPAAVPVTEPTDAELAVLDDRDRRELEASWERRCRAHREELGYGIVQSTRPQTLAYGLNDSPVGQLAWIAEKFHDWTEDRGLPDGGVDRDHLLANVTLYWLTATAGSSARLYWETAHAPDGPAAMARPSTAPTGVTVFPYDTSRPVRHLAERTDTIVHWSIAPHGGHFPAMEVPDVLVDEIRTFFRLVRGRPGPGPEV
jgi:pimeloyl-ACP methyl ester carboxylesterase